MNSQIRRISLRILCLFLLFCASSQALRAQTVAPFQGIGAVQLLDNNAQPLVNGVLYSYAAGTTTQQATYTDSTATQVNPNPIPFDAGGRANIWLTIGQFYKFVLCSQNDGSACASGDTLYTVDQVPGGATSSSGGGSPFTGIFISGSTNPATSGILRLASGDLAPCWRNVANSANLCWSLDSNNVLTWSAGSMKFPLVPSPVCGATGVDLLWADSGSNRWMMCNNGGAPVQIVGSGADINTSDQVVSTHLTAPLPLAQGGTGSASLTGLQGTDTLIQTAGTVAASQPLACTDALGGITTTGCGVSPAALQQVGVTSGAIGTSPTTVASVSSYTFPATGGPWRILASYQLPFNFTSSITNVDCWVTDGTNLFAGMTTANSNGAAGGKTNGDGGGWSATTYANGAGPFTISLVCQGNTGGASLLSAGPTSGVAAKFQFKPDALN